MRQQQISTGETGRTLTETYQALLDWFASYDTAIVAFSGGVDSAFVLKAAVDALTADKVLAVTADSPSLPRTELADGSAFVSSLGVSQVLLHTKEFSNPKYRANLGNRCYFCKSTLYEALTEELRERYPVSANTRRVVVDGTNADDIHDVRPGRAAAQEAGIKHPLVETAIDKATVRALSKLKGLATWDKPAMACLSSRIQTGLTVTEEKIAMVEQAEAALKALGLAHLRVRYHELKSLRDVQGAEGSATPLTLARVEVGDVAFELTSDLQKKIASALKDAGFALVTLDLEGYRKGGEIGGSQ